MPSKKVMYICKYCQKEYHDYDECAKHENTHLHNIQTADAEKSNDSSISPGSLGGKIRKLRELRGFTQKELGIRSGFSISSADVRIAQYEKNKKTPREKVLTDICNALSVDPQALYDADLTSFSRMCHALFDMEDFHGLHPVLANGRYYLEFDGCDTTGSRYNRCDYDDFLEVWYKKYQEMFQNQALLDNAVKEKETKYALWRYEFSPGQTEE